MIVLTAKCDVNDVRQARNMLIVIAPRRPQWI
jgi:hypothetical protein